MRVLIALDIPEDDLTRAYGDPRTDGGAQWDDLYDSLSAVLCEFYPGDEGNISAGWMIGLGDFTGCLEDFLSAAEVGAEGLSEDKRSHILGSIQIMRQTLEQVA